MSETPSSPPQEDIQGWEKTVAMRIAESHPENPPEPGSFDFGTQHPETQQDLAPPQNDASLAIPKPSDVEKPADSLATQETPDALAPVQQETALVHAPKTEGNTAPAVRVESQEEIAPTQEQQEKQRVDFAEKVAKEIREREEQRMIERYGEGKIGKMKRWLNETDAGRAVKIGGKIVVGTAAAITAGTLTGGIGLLAAPMVYSLGLKTAVDGGIEAVQYLSKGRNLRLQLEGAKHSMLSNLGENADKHYEKLMKGEITQQQYNTQVGEIIKGIADQEKAIITQEQGKDVWEKKQAKLRAVISSIAAVGIGMVTGVPLGMQDFDRDGISHAVRFGRHGFNFLYNATEMMGHAGGAIGHTLGHAIDARAYAGLGLAVAGLCLKTGFELKGVAARGEITSPEPKYLELIPQETALARVDSQTGLERAQTPPVNPDNPQSPPHAESSTTLPPRQEGSIDNRVISAQELIHNISIPIKDFKKMIVTQDDARRLVGLPETFTQDQFKKAKREFAKSVHPDVNGLSPRCQELFKVINPLLDQLETSALPNPEIPAEPIETTLATNPSTYLNPKIPNNQAIDNETINPPTKDTPPTSPIITPPDKTIEKTSESKTNPEEVLPDLLESTSKMMGDRVLLLSDPYYTVEALQKELQKLERVRDAYRNSEPLMFDEAERDIRTLQKWIEKKSSK